MRPVQAIDEATKYLSYVCDALRGSAATFGVDRRDKEVLEKYAADLTEYAKNLVDLKININAKEQAKRKLQVTTELELVHEQCKRVTKHAQENVRITDARLKKLEKDGSKKDLEETKQRLAYYMREYVSAQQKEAQAKRAMTEQGA